MQAYGRKPKMRWLEKVELEGVVVDGWFTEDKKEYLLKLPMEDNYKRFTGNSERMIEFLKLYGGIEVEGEEKGVHIDYNDSMGFRTQEDRFGRFVGADLYNHYRVEEMLRGMPENWGIRWGDGSYLRGKDNHISLTDVKSVDEKLVDESVKKKRIIRKVIRVVRRK